MAGALAALLTAAALPALPSAAALSTEAAAAGSSQSSPLLPRRPLTYRIMTYNIHAWRDSDHVDNLDRVVDVVNRCSPDILCLNEVLHPFVSPCGEAGRAYYDAVGRGNGRGTTLPPDAIPANANDSYLSQLASRTCLDAYTYGAATDVGYFGRGVPFGNAILSRHPILDCDHVPLGVDPGDVSLGNQPRDFVDPRSLTIANVVLPHDLVLGVCLTHLDQKSEQLREKQVLRCVDVIAKSSPLSHPHIFCGDWNTFRKSDMDEMGWERVCDLYRSRGWEAPEEESLVLAALERAGYADAFYRSDADGAGTVRPSTLDDGDDGKASLEAVHPDRGKFPGPTCWTKEPAMRIDHIWTSPDAKRSEGHDDGAFSVRPRRFSRVLVDGSDHYPVFVDLELVPI